MPPMVTALSRLSPRDFIIFSCSPCMSGTRSTSPFESKCGRCLSRLPHSLSFSSNVPGTPAPVPASPLYFRPSGRFASPFGRTDVLLGTSRVLLGASRVHLGRTRVLLGRTRVLLGTSRVLLGTSRVHLGRTRVLLGTSRVQLGASRVLPGTFIARVEQREGCFCPRKTQYAATGDRLDQKEPPKKEKPAAKGRKPAPGLQIATE